MLSRSFSGRDNVQQCCCVVASVSMNSEPSAVGSTFGVPTVVDQPQAARLRGAAAATRDQEFLEFVAASDTSLAG